MRAWLLIAALAACGDELPVGLELPVAANVTIVAHQDDDLLFMQPDLTELVEARAGLLNVYVTAGDGGADARAGITIAGARSEGLLKAYAQAAGLAPTWACGWIELAGHAAQHCRLDEANVSLVFLAYPDGGKEGEQPASLLRLWEGKALGGTTIALVPATYDRPGLIAAVGEIIATAKPRTIRTLEVAATHGRDHSDHMLVGALALLAAADVQSTAELISYRGYSTENEPATLIDPLFDRSVNLLSHYAACATGCATCGFACRTVIGPHATWLRRRYAVGMRPSARGALRIGGMCAGMSGDGSPNVAPCSATPMRWELTPTGV
ncbi:MAG: PIG-L family deacetylase, partial [Deltaproteobacteria bacterium]|nr:PIG-L family deacetylase [Deltaproteobacteria bacterium]